jgi:glycosyltransferase involved in cell wall biosynthesis
MSLAPVIDKATAAQRPLRVCHVITGFDTGGAERVLLQTVRRLDPARFESLVVSLRPRGPLSSDAERLGVETIHLRMGRRPGPVTLWRLAGIFQRRAVAVVHAYLYDASIASRLAGRWARVPVVLTSTRAPLDYLPRIAWWLDRATSLWCQRIIAVSQHTADFILQKERIARHKVVVVPNAVDLQRFTPREPRGARAYWGIDDGAFIVASVGRLSREKGHGYLLEALAIARSAIPSLSCLLAGDGPLRSSLETQARALGLDDVCHFLGDVREIETVFAAADLTVLPSLFEGMPNAVLEAMAMGCPVIATSVGGSPELVRHGETGLLVPPADSEALASALIELAESTERRNRMRVRSRQISEDFHGIERMIHSVEQLYLEEWERVIGETGVTALGRVPAERDWR